MASAAQARGDAGPWHVRGVELPDGTSERDWWVVDGIIASHPVADATSLPGRWVLPGGLVDAHVHLTMNFGRVMPHADGSDDLIAANARAHVSAGVLAVRDAGSAWGGVARQHRGGARLVRAGSMLAPPGRGYPNVCRVASDEQLVAAAIEEVKGGARWIKVLGDFPGPDGNWFAAPPNYSEETLSALVREVHAAGARVMAHSTGFGAQGLIRAGVDAIEHGMALSPALVSEMADRGIAWTLTLTTALKHVGALASLDSPVGHYIRQHFDILRELIPLADARGVPLLAGTDEIGVGALFKELQQIAQFGLSTDRVLAAGSTDARRWLMFPAAVDGQAADLVTYDSDPRANLEILATPSAILLGGHRFR